MKLLLEYRSSSLSKNSRSAPEYEIKVKVQNSYDQNSVKGGSVEEQHLKKTSLCSKFEFPSQKPKPNPTQFLGGKIQNLLYCEVFL